MSVVSGFFQFARPHDPMWAQFLSKLFESYDRRPLALSDLQNGATTNA